MFLNIINDIQDFFDSHSQVNEFGFGESSDISTKERLFPMIWLQPISSPISTSEIDYKFELYSFTLAEQDKDNLKDALNDTQKILVDFISYFKQNMSEDYWININDIFIEPFTAKFDDYTTGWKMSFNFITSYDYDNCNVPVPPTPTPPSTCFSTYETTFSGTEPTTWALYSEYGGEIADVTLTNISSYTIDGVSVTLPFELEFGRVYMVDVVKTDNDAKISFKTDYTKFTQLNVTIDFSIGDGKKTYGLDGTGIIYKLDNTLLTLANTSGVGTWTVDPLEDTIILPTLPAGDSNWARLNFIKDGKILISGGNGVTSKNKYFCYLLSDGTITDLDGNLNTYTTLLTGRNYTGSIFASFYNYIDDYVYFLEYSGGSNFFKLDLNTKNITIVSGNVQINQVSSTYYRNKNFFNPYKKVFMGVSEIDLEKKRTGTFFTIVGAYYKKCYNRKTGYYIQSDNGDYKRIYRIDQYSSSGGATFTAGTAVYSATRHMNLDHENNVYVGATNNNYFVILRIDEINGKAFQLQNPEGITTILNNGMFAYDNLHLLITSFYASQRLYCIDVSDPNSGTAPDFNYYDFPTTVVDMHTNRIL